MDISLTAQERENPPGRSPRGRGWAGWAGPGSEGSKAIQEPLSSSSAWPGAPEPWGRAGTRTGRVKPKPQALPAPAGLRNIDRLTHLLTLGSQSMGSGQGEAAERILIPSSSSWCWERHPLGSPRAPTPAFPGLPWLSLQRDPSPSSSVGAESSTGGRGCSGQGWAGLGSLQAPLQAGTPGHSWEMSSHAGKEPQVSLSCPRGPGYPQLLSFQLKALGSGSRRGSSSGCACFMLPQSNLLLGLLCACLLCNCTKCRGKQSPGC